MRAGKLYIKLRVTPTFSQLQTYTHFSHRDKKPSLFMYITQQHNQKRDNVVKPYLLVFLPCTVSFQNIYPFFSPFPHFVFIHLHIYCKTKMTFPRKPFFTSSHLIFLQMKLTLKGQNGKAPGNPLTTCATIPYNVTLALVVILMTITVVQASELMDYPAM